METTSMKPARILNNLRTENRPGSISSNTFQNYSILYPPSIAWYLTVSYPPGVMATDNLLVQCEAQWISTDCNFKRIEVNSSFRL
ncbi:hypothetical protein XELAEV_18001980mg [Xenopus laevis]|nr:hypothetical protein XELAEV_18001980mg [Xenopus laevis]